MLPTWRVFPSHPLSFTDFSPEVQYYRCAHFIRAVSDTVFNCSFDLQQLFSVIYGVDNCLDKGKIVMVGLDYY